MSPNPGKFIVDDFPASRHVLFAFIVRIDISFSGLPFKHFAIVNASHTHINDPQTTPREIFIAAEIQF